MEHVIDASRVHHHWDNRLEPTLHVASGDVVDFDLAMAGRGQIHEGATYEETSFDFDTLYNLLGPVFVEDARPGDALRVDILSLEPGGWGWSCVLAGLGLLAEDFPEPFARTWDLRDRTHAELKPGIRIPLAPFLGTMGTHPDEPTTAPAFPPHKGGGNVDTRHLVAGTTLWLPVWCEGALFSCGDPHAAQGDGEVCVSAIECDMRARLRFTTEKRSIGGPRFQTPGPLTPLAEGAGHHGTMGLDPDLMTGARKAVRATIDWLVCDHELSREEAYLLCSMVGDLKIMEIVDAGVWNVGFTIPLSVLGGR
jgi:acetamidase/formamidase